MSWWGGGEMSPTPGVEYRVRAIVSSTLWPGSSPPSPGLAPWAILICSSSEFVRYQDVTPNRPEATCLIAERRLSPFASGVKRDGSSPPSPVLLLPPRRFIATASISWLSAEIEPKLIAPVQKRLTIWLAGSTASSGRGAVSVRNWSRPRSEHVLVVSSLASRANCSYASVLFVRAACWSREIIGGSHMWRSPPARQW